MKLKQYYKLYCKILSEVIKEAKRVNCNKQVINSHNKMKTTWNIIKSGTGKKSLMMI
jgi:hypothetical protein